MKKTIMTRKNGECFDCVSHKPGQDGYPRARVDGKLDRTHRHVYRKFKGEIPDGMIVRHTCDNRLCCNPDHLILGTHADNARDRVERRRGATGEKNGRAKLTAEQAEEIRASVFTTSLLSEWYSVSPATIRRIQSGKTWKEGSICRRMTNR